MLFLFVCLYVCWLVEFKSLCFNEVGITLFIIHNWIEVIGTLKTMWTDAEKRISVSQCSSNPGTEGSSTCTLLCVCVCVDTYMHMYTHTCAIWDEPCSQICCHSHRHGEHVSPVILESVSEFLSGTFSLKWVSMTSVCVYVCTCGSSYTPLTPSFP